MKISRLQLVFVTFAACVFGPCLRPAVSAELPWWKGNLHTHSYWSDGDDYPEMIVDWYKAHGYRFLALSDHNILSEGEKWIVPTKKTHGGEALEKYVQRFGPSWVEQRVENGTNHVRLKPLNEFRHLFEEPNRFLLIQSEEITDSFNAAPVHLNATNLRDFIKPQGGSNIVDVMQRNVDAVLKQRQITGQPMIPHLNHPNFHWAITAEELMRVQGEKFFEVYNGHPTVYNDGDATHASTDRMWDIILTWRLAILDMEPIYGIAVDDSHHYHKHAPDQSNSGRGWIMVQAAFLTPEHIIHAMEAGNLYASSGVRLNSVVRTKEKLAIEIEPEPGVTYRTQFIGTRTGFDSKNEPVRNENGEELRVTRRYSRDVGAILDEVTGISPSYQIKGDEIYVRAKIISSKSKVNAVVKGEPECAWTQPAVTGVKLPRPGSAEIKDPPKP